MADKSAPKARARPHDYDTDPRHAYGWDLKHLPKSIEGYELVPYKHSPETKHFLEIPSDLAYKKSKKLIDE